MTKEKKGNMLSDFIDTFKSSFNSALDATKKVLIQKQEEESLNDRIRRIRDDFRDQFNSRVEENGIEIWVADDFWVDEVFETYIIVTNWTNEAWKIGYVENNEGFIFDNLSDWIEVEMKWVEVEKTDIQKSETNPIDERRGRAIQYGIEVLKSDKLMLVPGIGFSKDNEYYADPVNYLYPIHSIEKSLESREIFKKDHEQYKNSESLKIIHNRIVKSIIDFNKIPEVNEEDELDKLITKDHKQEIKKNISKSDFKKEVRIVKSDIEKRLVYGVVLEPDTVDLQEDKISPDIIEKAAHRYMIMFQALGYEHEEEENGASVVESYITKSEETHNGTKIIVGSWVMVTKIHDDDLWEEIKKGEITGYSIGGRAVKVEEDS